MTDLLSFLPGDIPSLPRYCSPVLYTGPADLRKGWRGVIDHEDIGQTARVAWSGGHADGVFTAHLALDLTDLTGRFHAAKWVNQQKEARAYGAAIGWMGSEAWSEAMVVVRRALDGDDMTPEQIDTLARLILRLAGR